MDLFGVATQALMARSPLAYPLAGVFGVVSSLGPCAVTRYATVAQAASSARRPLRTVAVFVAGIVMMYALFGIIASLLPIVQYIGAYLYLIAGVIFVLWGVRVAWSGLGSDHAECDVHAHEHEHAAPAVVRIVTRPFKALRDAADRRFGDASFVSVFLLGVFSACVISPCCAPFLGLTITVTAAAHDPVFGATVLSVFALGHAVPLIIYGVGGAYVSRVARASAAFSNAVAVVFGALMVGVGLSYLMQV